MPPRPAQTGSFSITDSGNEVVCPLKNQDGTNCRKRCFGEKRYRSMQEHIRRAHPEHYIPKLPATEESFLTMINTPPHERPPPPPQPSFQQPGRPPIPNSYYNHDPTSPVNSRHSNDPRRGSLLPAASAAAALAQLHNSRPDADWESQDPFGTDHDKANHLHNYFATSDPHNIFDHDNLMADQRQRDFFQAPMTRTPSGRAASLGPQRARPRKSSVTESGRKPKHERQRSKDQKRLSHDRKALSAEPSAVRLPGNRWEDLLDAAASATEEDSRDLTPIPQSPRLSQPPFHSNANHNAFQSYTASPLQNTVLPQSPSDASPTFEGPPDLQPFPSVEATYDGSNQGHATSQPYHQHHHHHSSGDSSASNPYTAYQRAHAAHHASQSSGSNFHIPHDGLTSSPQAPRSSYSHQAHGSHHQHHGSFSQHTQQASSPVVEHYCAACHRATPLTSSYACTECICGLCRSCVDILWSYGPERQATCPRCHTVGGKFKPFMLDLR